MATGELSSTLEQLCLEASATTSDDSVRRALDRVVSRLRAPLRVAVAGRRGAGKSTLVNAVVGAALAPTDLRECTRLVTSFSHGTTDCVHVIGRDGQRHTVGLDDDGRVPKMLPRPIDEVAHLEVSVTSGALRGLTVVDTPGLATTDADRAARTAAFLGLPDQEAAAARASDEEVAGAEAVLYVLGRTARADDRDVLDGLRAATSRVAASSINTVVVLNQIDRFARRGDPWVAAREAAQDYRERLAGATATVVPLIGVLAETLVTGQLGHDEITDLRLLAATPGIDDDALDTVDEFLAASCEVAVHRRRRLAALLTMYGVRVAVDAMRDDPRMTSAALHERLLERSGHPALAEVIERIVRAQADALKASWGIAQLEIAARTVPQADRVRLRSMVEDFLAEPAAYQLRLLEVAQAFDNGELELPDQFAADLRALVSGRTTARKLGCPDDSDPGALADTAVEAMNRWAAFAVTGASPDQARAAAVVRRAYQLMFRALTSGAPAATRAGGAR